jgi:fatty-acid desaturase
MAWYEVDFNYMGIQLLRLFGLARNVHALDAKTAMAKSQAR